MEKRLHASREGGRLLGSPRAFAELAGCLAAWRPLAWRMSWVAPSEPVAARPARAVVRSLALRRLLCAARRARACAALAAGGLARAAEPTALRAAARIAGAGGLLPVRPLSRRTSVGE